MSQKQFFILTLISLVSSLCNEGCLKCNKNNQCQICDVSKFMKLSNDRCESVQQDNCVTISLDGTCLQCKSKFYLDSGTKKCTAVLENNLVSNCLDYSPEQQCVQCENEFYSLNGRCVKVSIKISNCKTYLNDTTCAQCNVGYLLSLNGKTCDTKPSFSNCQDFSTIECVQCGKDFIMNKNIYQQQVFSVNSEFEIDYLLQWIQTDKGLTLQQDNVCQKQVVENCLEVEDYDSCKKCDDGYYLTDSKFCLPYPASIILNCEVYNSATVCGKCVNKYYKKNSNTCLPVILVENCLTYGQLENDQGCKECEPNFFLESGECKPRQNNVTNCQTFELTDRCKTCGTGYILTNDRLKCLPSILHCNSYESSSVENTALVCQQCIDGYFLLDNTCRQGSDVNCAKYTSSSTFENQTCQQCVNKFYLSEDNCLEIQTIANCSQYHQTRDKSCLQCEGLFFNFLLENKCEIFTETPNCIEYQKDGDIFKCITCADTYYLDTTQNTCENLSVSHPFCNKVDANADACIECQPNKILVDKQCVDNMPYNTEFCSEVNQDQDLSKAKCNICKDNSYPLLFNNISVCLTEQEFGQSLQVGKELCQTYNDDGSCKLCKDNYVENEGSCVTACPQGKYMVKYLDNRVNYCINEDSNYEQGCEIMSTYKLGSSTAYACSKCKSGYLPYFEDSSTAVLFGKTDDKSLDFMTDLYQRSLGFNCIQLTSSVTLNEQPNSAGQAPTPDPNCQYWGQKSGTSYYCIKCKDQYTFQIVNGVPQECKVDIQFSQQKLYSQNSMVLRYLSGYQCADRSLSVLIQVSLNDLVVNTKSNLKNTSNQCVSKQQIEDEFPGEFVEHCGVYILFNATLTCEECAPGYKKDNDKCIAIANCDGYQYFSGCSQCSRGYAMGFNRGGEILYDVCSEIELSVVGENCLALRNAYGCDLCMKGYMMNPHESCEKILFPKCDGINSFNYRSEHSSTPPQYYDYYYGAYKQGCHTCLDGYISVNRNITHPICFFSYFLRDNANYEYLSMLIPYCKIYSTNLGEDGEMDCIECYKGKLIDKNGMFCKDEIPNCKVMDGSTDCYECISNQFANISGECKQLEIENCLEYNVFSSALEQCKVCKDGYFPEGKKCVKTEVLNCKKPKSLTECDECIDNFNLVSLSADRSYCISLSTTNNCKEATIVTDGQYGGKITCTKCALPNSYITTQTETPELFTTFTECIRIDLIENCANLKFPQIMEATSFSCNDCVGNYYLSDSSLTCLQRNNLSLNCDIFDTNSDKCSICNNTSYLVDNGQDCQNFPDGLVGCKKYLYRYTCEICESGFYLIEGNCKQVPEGNLIENCEVYKNETECSKCSTGFFVSENICVEVKVSNCAILQDQNTCQECSSGYGLVVRGSLIDCELISKNRCIKFEQTTPYPCVICNEGFYPDENGECVESKPKIEFCIQQESLEKCIKCQKGSVLSKDQTKCYKSLQYVSQIPFECTASVEKEPFCTTCKPGYKFNKEGLSCIQCNAVQNDNGCSICDPHDDNKCFMCKSGYKQDQDGKCIIFSSQNDNNNQEVDQSSYVKVFNFEFCLLLLTMLI